MPESTNKSLERFYSLLLSENNSLNLTSHSKEELQIEVLEDCRQLSALIPENHENLALIDVGSGAGIPSIPLAIMLPRLQITSLEPIAKKSSFQQRAREDLKIENLSVITGRAEEIAHDPQYRGQYNFLTARAVAHLAVIIELTSALLKENGKFLLLKGPDIKKELTEAASCMAEHGVKLNASHAYETNGKKRTVLELVKIKESPINYPRSTQYIARLRKKLNS